MVGETRKIEMRETIWWRTEVVIFTRRFIAGSAIGNPNVGA